MPYTPAAVQIRFVYDDSEEEADLVERVIGRDEVERYREEIEVREAGARRGIARCCLLCELLQSCMELPLCGECVGERLQELGLVDRRC